MAEDIITFTDPTILKPINEQSYYDVASYTLFSSEDHKAVFKNKPFGIYSKELEHTEKFCVMIRKESIGITNVMKIYQNTQPIDWNLVHSLSP